MLRGCSCEPANGAGSKPKYTTLLLLDSQERVLLSPAPRRPNLLSVLLRQRVSKGKQFPWRFFQAILYFLDIHKHKWLKRKINGEKKEPCGLVPTSGGFWMEDRQLYGNV